MALRILMLRREIERKEQELAALRELDAGFETREAELESSINEVNTDEERSAVEAEIETFENERDAHNSSVTALEGEIETLRGRLAEEERNAPQLRQPAAPAAANIERSDAAMLTNINIRSLPMNQRAFDALPLAQRQAIVGQDDVKAFLTQLRSFKGQSRAVTGVDLTIPVVFLDIISENLYRYSKLLRRVRVRNVRGTTRQTVSGIVPEAVWTEMCAMLNELDFTFNQVELDGFKVAGIVAVCNSDLEDSDLDLAAAIIEMISESLGLAKDKSILYGKGAGSKMPLGIVTRLAQTAQPEGYPAVAPAWEDLHLTNLITLQANLTGAEFWSALTLATGNTFNRYARGTQFWAMNSKTYNLLKSKAITFTASGDVVANVYGVLPIINGDIDILEFMPDGDIVGGYGDLYLWTQRSGMTIGMDETGFTNRLKDQTVFFGKERADGTPVIARAFVAINISGQAPATSMTFAGDKANTLAGLMLPATATLVAGQTLPLQAIPLPFGIKADVTYSSGTPAHATVDANGVVTGVAAGTSVITVTAGGFTATCTVTVTAAG